ncbi:TonB-dependent receptor [Danxiaibacter flavus]|uniref:TonB-dependent receptor n=1 Tax=Danxiaibacter flavus TaxID=3049108 RepID=A0ABV3ZDX5_9BACT|nr:TonB-dependent receptor [Chitinophagaceae bacterium DXS]
MMKPIFFVALLFSFSFLSAQEVFKAVVKDKANEAPLSNVSVATSAGAKYHAISDTTGAVQINLPTGSYSLQFKYTGYKPFVTTITIPDTSTHTIYMEADENALSDVVVVSSTRNNDHMENTTMKVEVLGQEEMNEESTLKPGNVASILGDVSGIQIQQSSAVTGNANVRIQGLDGKYTQLLKDGMPLYDGYSGGFGILSILPLDLKQIELIKGSASTLYGGGAIGGLINFISKKPTYLPDASFVVNQTTLKETNLNAYYGQRWKRIGFTMFAGQTFQKEADVDKDGLSDVPNTKSTLIHPTLFIYPSSKSSIEIGWSGSFENRIGGDMTAIKNTADTAHPYFDKNKINRNTFTLIAENRFSNKVTATLKSSVSIFNRDETTNTYIFNGGQINNYNELSINARLNKHSLAGGVNLTYSRFTPDAATPAPVGTFSNTTAGAFMQDTWQILPKTKLEGGLRADHHYTYGNFLLPRLAIFQRFNDTWGARAGFGMGYVTPNPLAPQIKDYGIYDILPLNPDVSAERSYGYNVEVNFKKDFGNDKTLFINQAFFLTQINNPIVANEDASGKVSFSNESKSVVTKGSDTYIQLKIPAWEFYIGYTYTNAERKYLAQNQFMPLTPRNRAAATVVYEQEGKWRFGLEGSYTGSQYRDGDSNTPGYLFIAAMIERKFGPKVSLVLNCENLLDERQSRYESLFTGSVKNPDYKPLWAPIDGRVVNMALRIAPFAK